MIVVVLFVAGAVVVVVVDALLLPLLLDGSIVESYNGPSSTAACVWSCGTDTNTCPVHVPELLAGLASDAV